MPVTNKIHQIDFPQWLSISALLPLLAGLYASWNSISQGSASELLWVCNVFNFTLAIGLYFRHAVTLWISTLWILAGTPLWIWDNIERGTYLTVHAFFIHVVSGVIGLISLRYVTQQLRVWHKALLAVILLQLLTRLVADPDLNINMSASVYPALQGLFDSFLMYSLFNFFSFAFTLMLLERLIKGVFKRWPVSG